MTQRSTPTGGPQLKRHFRALLLHRRLALWLAGISTALLSPTLWIGFHLDDYVHRYLFSGLPGAADLLAAYQSPFGIANGDPVSNHWQVEAGYAPWWTHPHLLISLWRPLSTLTHRLDAALWPSSALLEHAHSLAWYFMLVLATTRLYRAVMGTSTVAGLAALMYALDQAHGFAVGWIANRNALVATLFGVLALICHHRARNDGVRGSALLSPLLFACALLAGEGAIAIFGYLLGYALFLDPGRPRRRLWSLLPHAVVVVAWRVAYDRLGRGAAFSGLYLDPLREPLRFASAMLERIPLLLLGQLGLPPAETYEFVPSPLAQTIWLLALTVAMWLLVSLLPLLLAERQARFWAFGTLAALVPACTTHANNRLLFFVGLGAMALLSQLWHGLRRGAEWLPPSRSWRRAARGLAGLSVGFHLALSPLLLPLSGCSIVLTSGAERAVESALSQAKGRELIILSSPDYFYVKLLLVVAALERRRAPRRLRALSFGAVALRIERRDAHTLALGFEGGLLGSPLLELYRARELVMPRGSRVRLEGLAIEVEQLTADGRIAAARFRFDAPLEDPRFCFLYWDGDDYRRFELPLVGQVVELAPAELRLGLTQAKAPAYDRR
jgi:hypothetical protein